MPRLYLLCHRLDAISRHYYFSPPGQPGASQPPRRLLRCFAERFYAIAAACQERFDAIISGLFRFRLEELAHAVSSIARRRVLLRQSSIIER